MSINKIHTETFNGHNLKGCAVRAADLIERGIPVSCAPNKSGEWAISYPIDALRTASTSGEAA